VRDLEPSVDPDEYHNWILVAWALRERVLFRKISKVLLLEGSTDGVGFFGKHSVLHPNLPDSVIRRFIPPVGKMWLSCRCVHHRANRTPRSDPRSLCGLDLAV